MVHPGRLHQLNSLPLSDGPIIYWMSRDQRVNDNWALIHAQQLALEHQVPLAVVFILAPAFLGATLRQYGFMLKGLEECAARLAALGIPFYLLQGHPPAEIITFIQQHSVGGVVTDFDPLRIKRGWREEAAAASSVSFIEVDAHNIVPCRVASTKQEFGAYTIRPKIHRLLSDFLEDFPPLQYHPFPWPSSQPHLNKADYASVLSSLQVDRSVQEVTTVEPGGSAAHRHLRDFILSGLDGYDLLRNDPNLSGQSGLSPYLHFGQISAQRVALEAGRAAGGTPSGDAFLEELVVRRELSDNFCWYNMNYDCIEGFPDWARQTLKAHRHDQREFLYTPQQFECSRTHDPLWNAAQREMVTTGRMHGYMRMYWAKKILEWSPSPEEAMQVAIYLNDRYELDGRDPNGYTGIAWSIGGVHDRAWGERPVFGKIRYMNDKGCRRKFDVEGYIGRYSE
ncbi:deoxyribodipyrimidine photo-lyase [Pelotalea chapellei]|uniref:Deoxyribodipyrimidine photo-lyase n=1 Tax=Pelotalea chapellei TaxID=44671 RepID=A0ABS5U3Z8_9BACT|nr:deoxyribodipyrimidine photo-lyase [Pelotalea chapellei]